MRFSSLRSLVPFLIVGLTAATCGDTAEPAIAPSTTPIVTTTSSGRGEALVWTRVEVAGGDVSSVAPLGDRFVGSLAPRGAPPTSGQAIVVSRDGTEWSPIDDDLLEQGEGVAWLTGGPWGAAGRVTGTPALEVIVSLDGRTWTRHVFGDELGGPRADRWLQAIAVGPHGVIAVVFASDPASERSDLVVIASDDGSTWRPAELPSDSLVFPFGIGSAPVGYLIVGEPPGGPESHPSEGAVAWFSPDASTWRQVDLTNEVAVGFAQPTTFRSGFLVVGAVTDGDSLTYRLWRSADGLTWDDATPDAIEGLIPLSASGSAAGVLVVASRGESSPSTLLFTADGDDWSRWEPSEFDGGAPGQIAAGADRFLLLISGATESGEAELWVGTAPG